MTEQQLRNSVVSIMKSWLGYSEANGKFKTIINIYNAHKPLAQGYKVQYNDAWCATAVSAAFIRAGLTDIAPTECSCPRMVQLFKAKGRWKEADNYVPKVGDIIMYDWGDRGYGDNTGTPDHVGIVASVSGTTITVIEGNKGEAVAYRNISVNGKYIRGYCLPDYASKADNKTSTSTASNSTVKVEPAKGLNKSYAKSYIVTASALNMRSGAGTNKSIITVLNKGEKFRCYGYYTQTQDGTIWLYGVDSDGNTGFCSKKYLS